MVILLLALSLVVGSFWAARTDLADDLRIVAAAVAAIGLVMFLAGAIRRSGTEFVVTDRRVIFKRGILARHTVEMNVSKIESVDVEQGLGARLLGYGNFADPRDRFGHRAAAAAGPAAGDPQRDRRQLGGARQKHPCRGCCDNCRTASRNRLILTDFLPFVLDVGGASP